LTRDHTFVQQLVDGGALTPTQALSHPQRNQVTQALGAAGLQELDVGTVLGTLRPGQALLLCSDGLTGEVPDQRIRDVLAAEGDEQTKVDRLIDLALDAGAPDNVTVVLVSIPGA
ncbi:MAG TPA: serine/threonine-protein phosphatase, partial [Gammaproteobacteria bacterium]|nr:serine/threonine-protein phosphatase [Gammaproteobacteria bacterium]